MAGSLGFLRAGSLGFSPVSSPHFANCTGKKTPGGAGTHTGHTRDTRAHTGTRITQRDEPHNQPNPTSYDTPSEPHDHATAETAADSTAA